MLTIGACIASLILACARSFDFCITHRERSGGVKPTTKTRIVSNKRFSLNWVSIVTRLLTRLLSDRCEWSDVLKDRYCTEPIPLPLIPNLCPCKQKGQGFISLALYLKNDLTSERTAYPIVW
jgi:hypothetical protein